MKQKTAKKVVKMPSPNSYKSNTANNKSPMNSLLRKKK